MKNLLSVIVIATVVFCCAACEDPVSTPLEYGNVCISFTNDATGSRTIYPSKIFDHYVYTFTKQGGAPRAMSPSDGVFALEIGSWNVRVDAYIGAAVAATGSADFTLDADESRTVSIFLQAEETTGYGIFRYHIQYPAHTTEEIFTLTKLPEMTTVDINPVTGETALTGTAGDIPAGIYQLNVRFANNGLYAGTNEIVYIFALLTTEYGTAESPVVFEEQDFSNLLPIMNAEIVIIAPVKTATPHTAAESAAGHFSVGAASWSPSHTPFLGGTVYTTTVTLTANNGYTFTKFSSATINGEEAAISNNTGAAVTLSYTFPVTDERTVTGIALKTQPDNLIYTHGDPLDLAGLVVTLTHDDTTTEDVEDADFTAKNITTNPAHGNHLAHETHDGEPVTITYGDLTPITTTTLTVNKADPAITWPTGLTATFGQTLSNISLPGNSAGTFTWTTPSTSVGNVGTRSFSMTFTPTDTANYNTLTQSVSITVNKANPTVTWPTGLTATYGQTLANISLSGKGTSTPAGAFTWTTSTTSVGNVGTRSFSMTFTPTDTANYNTLTQNVSITVSKANPTVTWPTGLTATYGQTLANISLPGNGTSAPAGAFTWTTPSTSVGNAGTRSHNMTFTPTDTANYNTLTQSVSITVSKANPTVTWPTGLTAVYGQTLANISLSGKGSSTPAGTFTWGAPSTSVGALGTKSFSMTFTPTDTTNYNTLTQNVSITVSKANPTVTWPTAATITYGAALSTSTLNGGSGAGSFAWTNGTTIPTVTNSGYQVTFTPTDTTNYNTLTQNVSITVNARSVTITAGTPNRTLIPFDSSDTQYSTNATFSVTVSGLVGSDTITVGIATNSYGLSLSNNTGIGSAGKTVTLTYNRTSSVTQTTALNIGLTISGNTNYTLSGSPTVRPTVIDGQATARAIPVTSANITAFNTYANTTNGLTRHYKQLTGNIYLSGTNNWTAIGTNTNRFTGSFDGQNYMISNLSINSTSDYQGMFAYIGSGGMVQNLRLFESILSGSRYVGGVAGFNNGTVQNCYVTASNFSGSSYVGGVAGFNNGTVQNCYFTGRVSGSSTPVGGVAGYNGGTVQNCYVNGSVSGSSYVGGVAGSNYGTVQNCYVMESSVNSSDDVGAVLGGVVGDNGGTVQNCYATGNVSGNGEVVGGVVGHNTTGGTVQNCYVTSNVIGGGSSVGGVVGWNSGTVRNCVALNPVVLTAINSIGRIVGYNDGGTLAYNCARSTGMTLTYNNGVTYTPTSNITGKDGQTTSASAYTAEGWWKDYTIWWSSSISWDFTNVWQWNSTTNLPILRNMPAGTQNHTVP